MPTDQSDLPPASFSPTTGVRGTLDALIQGSLVDLFQAYGVALAPLPRTGQRRSSTQPETCAAIEFTKTSSQQTGRLVISIPNPVLELMKGSPVQQADWARELANQLLGRIKNRLLQFSVRVELGVPHSIEGNRAPASATTRVYAARTLRGEVVVEIDGLPNESEFVYVGPSAVAAEGDTILFE